MKTPGPWHGPIPADYVLDAEADIQAVVVMNFCQALSAMARDKSLTWDQRASAKNFLSDIPPERKYELAKVIRDAFPRG